MKKSLIYIVPIIFSIVFCSQLKATISGNCVNCHTIHNSQDGSDMATYGGISGENPCLTRGGCIGCHAYDASGSNNVVNIEGSLVPQVWHTGTDLAAGNFKYIKDDDDNKGHNIAAIEQEDNVSMFPPPGCEINPGITATNFSCAGKYGCHGDRTEINETISMKGAHHADDSTLDGRTTGTSYRFLKGVLGLENNGVNPWQNKNSTDHNEYKGLTAPANDASATSPGSGGSISGFCAECHGYYHGYLSEYAHPTDHSLDEYRSYTNYNVIAPVARVVLPETPSSIVTPAGTTDDIVMCLSCHGAHATNYYKLMRWDNLNNWSGCSVCHKSIQ